MADAQATATRGWSENQQLWEVLLPFLFHPGMQQAAVREVDAMVSLLGLRAGSRILDLGCGGGRHSLELSRRGFHVCGVDSTAAYTARAAQAAQQRGLSAEFVCADMRAFCRPAAFDAVVSMFNSFGYFEDPDDDLLVLDNVRHSLVPGGLFLIEVLGKEALARVFSERDFQESEDGSVMLHYRQIQPGWRELHNRLLVLKDGERNEFLLRHRLYSGSEFDDLLRRAHFSEIRLHGSVAGTPYDHTAQRLVAVAQV